MKFTVKDMGTHRKFKKELCKCENMSQNMAFVRNSKQIMCKANRILLPNNSWYRSQCLSFSIFCELIWYRYVAYFLLEHTKYCRFNSTNYLLITNNNG